MAEPKIQRGETVNITITGVRVFEGTRPVSIEDEHGDRYLMPPHAVIERVAPAEWPPRKNDVWRDRHGELLIGAVWAAEGPVLRSVDGSDYDGPYALAELAPLTLIHREQQDGGESCG